MKKINDWENLGHEAGLMRELFKTLSTIVSYEDEGDVKFNLPIGSYIWVSSKNEHDTRTLNGKNINAVRFMVAGNFTWCWMPEAVFSRLTRKAVVNFMAAGNA